MRVIRQALLLVGFLFLTACAQRPAITASALSMPEKQLMVPFIPQDDAYCGPSALAMVLAQQNKTVSVSALADEMLLPARGGSLQTELKVSVRRQGYLAYDIAPELPALLHEIDAGRPVIVLLNLAFNWYPKWHYAVVTGYDLSKQEIILHSGFEANQHWSFTQFENLWQRGGRWGLLVLSPHQLPPDSAQEQRYLQAVLDLGTTSGPDVAQPAYQAAIQRWPDNLTAMIGLGLIAYQQHDLVLARQWFQQAATQHPDSAVAANNLAQVLLESGDLAGAFVWAQKAVLADGGAPARDTLSQVLHALHAE